MSSFGAMLDRIQDATMRGGLDNRAQIKFELNESIKQVDALVRPAIASSVEVVTAGDGDYSIINDFLITNLTSIRDVQYTPITGASPRSLRESTPEEIRALRRNPPSASYVDLYALEGLDYLLLYPISTSVGDTLTVWYVPRPVDLTLDSDVPTGLPVEFHDLYEYACIPRSMRQTSPEETARYLVMYDKRLGDYRKWRNRRAGARSRVVVPKQPYRRAPRDPSTDTG